MISDFISNARNQFHRTGNTEIQAFDVVCIANAYVQGKYAFTTSNGASIKLALKLECFFKKMWS